MVTEYLTKKYFPDIVFFHMFSLTSDLWFIAMYHVIIEVLTEALALIGGTIDEDLGGNDVTERQEHLHKLRISKLLGQVVDKQVAALGS